jgi:hypothetical protein
MSAALAEQQTNAPAICVPAVPAEYIGRARELRARLIAASDTCSAAIDAATARALRRHHRSPVPRLDDLVDLARAWRCSVGAAATGLGHTVLAAMLNRPAMLGGDVFGTRTGWPDLITRSYNVRLRSGG